jgi:predicted Rossmann fold flavoprotein
MAAIFAASAGAQTTLIEATADGGRKILISGGGRCNVLPLQLDERRFITDSSPNTLRRILRSWPLAEQRRFFEDEVGIPLSEEPALKKVFPASHKARDVRDGLLALARRRGAVLRMGTRVTDLRPNAAVWEIRLDDGSTLTADAVILATGGLSVPATGSDGFGLTLAAQLGHTVHATYPALTPITDSDGHFAALAGVSLPVALSAQGADRQARAEGGFLFTHRGYSGPAALDVAHVLIRSREEQREPATLQVQWSSLDAAAWEQVFRGPGSRTVLGAVRERVPDRLAARLIERAAVHPDRTIAELRRDERLRLITVLVRDTLPWSGDEGYKKAEVTGGGVSLAEIDSRSMESRLAPGLFLCGELLDAFGPIGGYNFYWAWATGRAAGIGAAQPAP